MPVNFSIKNVADDLAGEVHSSAARNRQGELLVIREESVGRKKVFSPSELLKEIRSAGLRTPSESASINKS